MSVPPSSEGFIVFVIRKSMFRDFILRHFVLSSLWNWALFSSHRICGRTIIKLGRVMASNIILGYNGGSVELMEFSSRKGSGRRFSLQNTTSKNGVFKFVPFHRAFGFTLGIPVPKMFEVRKFQGGFNKDD